MNAIDGRARRDAPTLFAVQLSPPCVTCEAFLAKEAAAGRVPQLGSLSGLGAAVVIRQGYPDAHYGFRSVREGNACPTCRRRIVGVEDGPRSHGWTLYLELVAPKRSGG